MKLAERGSEFDLRDLAAENVDVEVGRGQHHVPDFRRQAAIADRHLSKRLDRDVIAHRVGENRDRADGAVVDERLDHRFERVARI